MSLTTVKACLSGTCPVIRSVCRAGLLTRLTTFSGSKLAADSDPMPLFATSQVSSDQHLREAFITNPHVRAGLAFGPIGIAGAN